MRRSLIVGLLLLTAACSDDEGDRTDETQPSTTVASSGDDGWIYGFDVDFAETTIIDGKDVGIDLENETVYVQDCGLAEDLTAEGAVYGPTNGEPGFAYICDS